MLDLILSLIHFNRIYNPTNKQSNANENLLVRGNKLSLSVLMAIFHLDLECLHPGFYCS